MGCMDPVSMLDVARAACVSKNTVSLALRGDPQIPEIQRGSLHRAANPTVRPAAPAFFAR